MQVDDNRRIEIGNGRVIGPDGLIREESLLIEGGKIIDRGNGFSVSADTLRIDAGGCYVSPGFIDMHVHGGGGFDFMDGEPEAFLAIARTHARFGTTAMLPTTLSGSQEELIRVLEAYASASAGNTEGSVFLGMHLEGPYFSMAQRGAQDPRYIRDPVPAEYRAILDRFPYIKRWSVAPERQGALEMGRVLQSRHVLASIAHTDAIYEEVEAAVKNGYSLVTHLYSGMSGVTRKMAMRYAGVIEAALLLDELDVEIIADGVHLPAPLLKLVVKVKGPEKIALVTDAMRAAAMPPGEYMLGSRVNGLPVIVEDGVAKLPDRSSFAGSVATADRLVRTMVDLAGLRLPEAIGMASTTPARILGLAHAKGSLRKGMDADIVILDHGLQARATLIGGRIVHNSL